jgi:hypothetical protein
MASICYRNCYRTRRHALGKKRMQNDQNVEKYLRIGMFGDTQGRLGTKCIELGNRCSIRLSYGTGKDNFAPRSFASAASV